jgi:hypothetical protein
MTEMWKYKIGTVVRQNKVTSSVFTAKPVQLWGHITGFSQVPYESCNETILMVRWENGEEYPTHPGNILLEGDTE